MRTSNTLLTLLASSIAAASIAQVVLSKAAASIPEEYALTGERASRAYAASALTHIRVEGPMHLVLSTGVPSVTVRGDAGVLAQLDDLDGDPAALAFELPAALSFPDSGVVAYVSTPALEAVELVGNARATSAAALDVDELRVSGSGNPSADLALAAAERIEVGASGGMTLAFRGVAREVELDVSGGNTIEAGDLRAERVVVNASGGNTAHVFADSSLEVRGSGSTKVFYRGAPRVSSSGSGSLQVEGRDR